MPIGCFLVLFAFISPRLALFALFLFSDLLSRAFDSWFVPFLGFFLLPWTTLAYAVMWSSSNRSTASSGSSSSSPSSIDLGSYANRQPRPRRGLTPGYRPGAGGLARDRVGEADVALGEHDEGPLADLAVGERGDLDVGQGTKSSRRG